MSNMIVPEGAGKGISRRQFLAGSGAIAGAAALLRFSSLTPAQRAGAEIASAASLKDDVEILQFALTLEHLEDAAYRAANASGAAQRQGGHVLPDVRRARARARRRHPDGAERHEGPARGRAGEL